MAPSTSTVPNLEGIVRMLGISWPMGSRRGMSISEALRLAAVQICVDVISQDIAKTPLFLRERLASGGSRIVRPAEHPVAAMFASRPNRWHTWQEFHEMVVTHLAFLSNAFIGMERGPKRRVISMTPFLPGRVRILIDEDVGEFVYEVRADTAVERVMLRPFADPGEDFPVFLLEGQVMHLRSRVIDGIYGQATLDTGSQTMWLLRELADYQTRLYRNDAAYRGVFQMEAGHHLNDEAFDRLRQQLAEGLNAVTRQGRPLLLEDGVEFKPITMTGKDSEVAEARKAAILDVARLWRIPPHKIGALESVKYDNMDTAERAYVDDTLIPYCVRIEQNYDLALLSDADRDRFFVRFDRESMLLSDPEKRAQIMRVMIGHGAMTIDEARESHGLNPLPDKAGQVRLVPSTFNVVDGSNEIVLAAGGAKPDQTPESAADAAADSKSFTVIDGGRV